MVLQGRKKFSSTFLSSWLGPLEQERDCQEKKVTFINVYIPHTWETPRGISNSRRRPRIQAEIPPSDKSKRG